MDKTTTLHPGIVAVPEPEEFRASMAHAVKGSALREAAEALRRTRDLAPAIASLVEMVTGKRLDVVVRPDLKASCTDGKTIYIVPDIRLGKHIPHNRKVCGKRDEVTLRRLCQACGDLDTVIASLFHEAAHVAFGTFVPMSELQKRAIVRRVLDERGVRAAIKVEGLMERLADKSLTIMEVCHIISPYLPMLFNSLEDARVNRSMYRERPGLQDTFEAKSIMVFNDGVPLPDGTRYLWSEAPLDAQAIIGTYVVASGYDSCLEKLSDGVQPALRDPELKLAIAGLASSSSAEVVYVTAFRVLAILRKHGLCDPPPEEEDEEGGEDGEGFAAGMDGESGESDSEESGGMGSAIKADGGEPTKSEFKDSAFAGATTLGLPDDDEEAPDLGTRGTADDDEEEGDEADAGDDDKAGDDEGDAASKGAIDADDDEEDGAGGEDKAEAPAERESLGDDEMEALRQALSAFAGHDPDGKVTGEEIPEDVRKALMTAAEQAEHFDEVSTGVSTVHVHKFDGKFDERMRLGYSKGSREYYRDDKLPEALIGKTVLKARMVFGENQAFGYSRAQRKGDLDSARMTYVRAGYKDVMRRRDLPDTRDYFCLLGLDISGSTAGGKITTIKSVGRALGEVFHRIQVKSAVYCHSGQGGTSGAYELDLWQIQGPDEDWGPKCHERLDGIVPASANLDGHTMEFYRKVIERRREQVKIMFYLTDGAMPAENPREELALIHREIEVCKRLGIVLVAIAVGNNDPLHYGLDTIRVDSVADLPYLVSEVEKRLIRR